MNSLLLAFQYPSTFEKSETFDQCLW